MTQALIHARPQTITWRPPCSATLLAAGAGYLAGYVLLDWMTAILSTPFRIAVWNPGIGLGFAFTLLFGWRFLPMFILALFAGNIVVHGEPLSVALGEAAILGAGYGVLALALLHRRLRFDPSLSTLRDLFLLLSVAIAGMAPFAAAHSALLTAVNAVQPDDFITVAARQWLGDVIGVIVVTPFVLTWSGGGRISKPAMETMLQTGMLLAVLTIFYLLFKHDRFGFFPLLFLPIIWLAIRSGLTRVFAAILFVEIGLLFIIHIEPQNRAHLIDLQARLAALAMVGLVSGVLVNEWRHAEIGRYRDALNRLGRLGGMGTFAGMLAHEINQPLTAASTYARLVAETLESDSGDKTRVMDMARKTVEQVERASEVMRRLRTLIRFGRAETAPVDVSRLVRETLRILAPDIERNEISVREAIGHDVPQVMADTLQIEQVLFNLVRNAIEAMRENPKERRKIVIEAGRGESGFVEFRVRDTGPGFSPEFLRNEIPLLFTTKPDGLGLGLSLCQSIVAAHGGRLWFGGDGRGAVVHFTLPVAGARSDD